MRASPYHDYLQSEARRLAGRYGQIAVPIGRIAYDHGIHIERSSHISKFRAHMLMPDELSGWARVLLPSQTVERKMPTASNYDRFCVAHELAHLLLYREFEVHPSDNASYWKHEYICDSFARALLVPDHYLHRIPFGEMSISNLQKAVDDTKVPLMHVARRVTERLPFMTFLSVAILKDCKYKVIASSMSNARGTGCNLRNILALRVESLLASSDETRTWMLQGSSLVRSNLEFFSSDSNYKVVARKDRRDIGRIILACMELEPNGVECIKLEAEQYTTELSQAELGI